MNKLSASLITKIKNNPTNTILRSYSDETNKDFETVRFFRKNPKKIPIPETFDGRITWKGLLTPVFDQGKCGSCWGFASTGMLGDRFNIRSMGLMKVVLSAAKVILCDTDSKNFSIFQPDKTITETEIQQSEKTIDKLACFGNTLVRALNYLYIYGTTSEGCVPYKNLNPDTVNYNLETLESTDNLPLCNSVLGPNEDMCVDYYTDTKSGTESGTPAKFFRCELYYSLYGVEKNGVGGENQIKTEIFFNGPVATGFEVYPDFYDFNSKKEIYKWNGQGPRVGGHAVVIIGWGEENGVKYWLIRNSWGEKWGDRGYFKMIRGINNCKIEENCMAAFPDYFYPPSYNFLYKEEKKILAKQTAIRNELSSYLPQSGGGIDLITGYSRRVMGTTAWLNYTRPVRLEDLPEWENFIAGLDATPQKRAIYQSTIREKYSDIRYSKQSLVLYTTSTIILILTCILAIIFIKN